MIDSFPATIAIRLATPEDDGVLDALSQLDAAGRVERPALLGTLDGTPVAALSLPDGRVVADPFRPTSDVVALLRAGRQSMRDPAAARHGRRRRVWRLRPSA